MFIAGISLDRLAFVGCIAFYFSAVTLGDEAQESKQFDREINELDVIKACCHPEDCPDCVYTGCGGSPPDAKNNCHTQCGEDCVDVSCGSVSLFTTKGSVEQVKFSEAYICEVSVAREHGSSVEYAVALADGGTGEVINKATRKAFEKLGSEVDVELDWSSVTVRVEPLRRFLAYARVQRICDEAMELTDWEVETRGASREAARRGARAIAQGLADVWNRDHEGCSSEVAGSIRVRPYHTYRSDRFHKKPTARCIARCGTHDDWSLEVSRYGHSCDVAAGAADAALVALADSYGGLKGGIKHEFLGCGSAARGANTHCSSCHSAEVSVLETEESGSPSDNQKAAEL